MAQRDQEQEAGASAKNDRSPLCSLQPEPFDAEEIKRSAYREDGLVVINLREDRLDMVEREIGTQWAERRYGRRRD